MDQVSAIAAELAAKKAAHNAARETETAAITYELSQEVKALQGRLSAAICDGAAPCKQCGGAPLGILHPQIVADFPLSRRQRQWMPFEIRCQACVISSGGDLQSHSARSTSREATLAEWSALQKG